jgi:apolipoprotein N-acyltransferase
MLGLSFPPIPFGVLACFGLVPLLIVLADIDRIRTGLRYSYITFLVFHVITVSWTGGYSHGHDMYMMIAGGITVIGHPLFYFIPISVYMFIKKNHGDRVALVALPFVWVAYEYSHTLSEWSFPWLTLGNSQTYDLAIIQFISTTGVLGLSFWILTINVLAFFLYSRLANRQWTALSLKSRALVLLILILYFLPKVYGSFVLAESPAHDSTASHQDEKKIRVGIIQSNIDPWEKWKFTGHDAIDLYLRMTRDLIAQHPYAKPDLVLWPETAVPYPILLDANRALLNELHASADSFGVSILTGLPNYVFYKDSNEAPPSAGRIKRTGERYDAFNSAALIQPDVQAVPWYGKMKMVPIAERVPYADAFYYLDFLRWDVGIGGWQIGRDSTIFEEVKTGSRFNTLICYESVYPEFVSSFVKKGAEFISLITIDSWWGKMPGAYQHEQFAILRAVENRRWIARCAVGGFSCFIDPYGRAFDKTELFTRTTIVRTIGRSDHLTFYTEHGEWLGSSSMLVAGLFLAAAFGKRFLNKKRTQS